MVAAYSTATVTRAPDAPTVGPPKPGMTVATLARMAARRTKIMATIGPASDRPGVLRDLVDAGMDAARVGLAHGDVADSIARIDRIRSAATAAKRHIAILVDLPGPKVRAAAFPEDGTPVEPGAVVRLMPSSGAGDHSDQDRFAVDYAPL